MKFNDYYLQRDKKEIETILGEYGITLSKEQIEILVESNWLSRTRKGLGKAALLASLPFAMSANWADHQPKPYHFHGDRLMANQQQFNDEASDKAYIEAGGPRFTDRDAEKFLKFRSTPEHNKVLKRAGLPADYIPSPVRQFVYGVEISSAEEMSETKATIEGEVKKHFGRDSFVSIVQSRDAVTGGSVLWVRIQGVVVAMNEQDAVKRAEVIITEIARNKGFEVQDFKDMHKPDIEVKQASRSTIDYAAESTAVPYRFIVGFKMVPVKKEWTEAIVESADVIKREMKNYLRNKWKGLEDVNSKEFDDDMEIAIHWFSQDHHSGQWSDLYSISSTSPYRPSILSKGIKSEDETVQMLYNDLEEKYAHHESVKNENLRTHRERDPFARHEIVGRPVDAGGKTCDFCGSPGKNGKLLQYTIESDGGRTNTASGLFCCKSCFRNYNS